MQLFNYQRLGILRSAGPILTLLAAAAVFLVAAIPSSVRAEVTAKQRRQVASLAEQSKAASSSFAKGDVEASAEAVRNIQSELLSLLRSNPDPGLLRLARPLYQRLATAHGLLELEGIELEPLPTWKEISEYKPKEPENGVSFVEDVAPWLITRCGNCHIDESRGGFSMRSFVELRRGTAAGVVLFPGSPRDSRIVDVIETGDMPRGGGQVSTAQLDNMKAWIAAGAKFDGPDPNAPMREYVFATRSASGETMTIDRATGDETVSFLADIAPLLIENCNGCHLGGQRPSGGLQLDSLAQLLAGGDSGEIVAARKPGESLLVRKLKGQEGQRMPAGGRPPLSDQQIAKIETWIREGAKFDGASPDASIVNETQRKWAESASHADLLARRTQDAIAQWQRVQPDDEPNVTTTNDLIFVSGLSSALTASVKSDFEAAVETLRSQFKIPNGEPIVKGGIAVYMLESRYDYSEFGQMIENRELPRSWRAHWARSGMNIYTAALVDSGWTEETAPSAALHALAGAYFGSFRDVPYWFAEGAARHSVVKQFRRGSPLVAQWQSAGLTPLQRLRSSKDLLEGKIDEEAAGVAGLRLASVIFDRRNSRRAGNLLDTLREGKTFDAALSASFGSPDAFTKSVLGK